MYLGKIIKRPDVQSFEESLQDHQKVVSQEGFSVLGKALIEHNIQVISSIYQNISFDELGRFLEIPAVQAEQIIASMVSENRIRAILDQKERIVEFLSAAGSDSATALALNTYNS
jgi:COP9 signalosome complex subunit 4